MRRASGRRVPLLLFLLAWQAQQALAQEIAPFRLTGVEGHAGIRYLGDRYSTSGTGLRTRQSQADMREEINVMTHSYIYHPGLVSLDIGGGPMLQQGRFAGDAGGLRARDELYNFSARASFLRDKPYRGVLFYEHLNPSLSIAPGVAMLQENTRYGGDVSLLPPASRLPLHFDASRSHSRGSSVDRVLDDRIDVVNLRAQPSYGALGSSQLQLQATRQHSASGSPGLPIQQSESSTQGVSADTRLAFGAERQVELTNLLALNSQAYSFDGSAIPDRRDARALFDVRVRHSPAVDSFARYNYSAVRQSDSSATVHSGSGGASWRPVPGAAATLAGFAEQGKTPQLVSTSRGVDASAQYRRALGPGSAQASLGVRLDQRSQEAGAAQAGVIGERMILAGTGFVSLARQRVVPGSIVVSNATRSQVFLEGRDYLLLPVGLQTRLQRLVGGNILDGEEVLLDYAYDTGGTFAYTQADRSWGLNWSLRSLLNVYYRHFESTPRLESGVPTFPLNTVKSDTVGLRSDVPVWLLLQATLGGGVEHERREETISPYRRDALDLYLQAEDPWVGGTLRAATRRMRVRYESAVQDVNLTGYDVNYWSRHPYGVELAAQASYERDTGGPLSRQRLIASAKALWRYRKLTLSCEVSGAREEQGGMQRTRTLVQMLARRDF